MAHADLHSAADAARAYHVRVGMLPIAATNPDSQLIGLVGGTGIEPVTPTMSR